MAMFRRLLIILGGVLLFTTCAAPRHLSPCSGGKAHPDRPIVCVDDSADVLKVLPDPVVFHDVLSSDSTMSPSILWFTKSGRGDLQIRFRKEGCVRDIRCNGPKCVGAAARLDALQDKLVCKYDVMLTGHPTLDPEGIIVRCCISSDVEPVP